MERSSLRPLKIRNLLAVTPKSSPQFPVTVKDGGGKEIILGDPKCTRALVALMNQHVVVGGGAAHWGGPAAYAEAMSSIHGLMFSEKNGHWADRYNFINDAGHAENGVYALRANLGFDNLSFDDLMGFRSIESKLTGHGEAHLNPEGVLISNGPLGSGLPQAQGVAAADKAIGNDRLTVCALSDGASMEGEAKESFSAIPGLAKKGKLNPIVLVISDNNTKLSGRIDADAFSMEPSLNAMESLGWKVIKEGEGNNIQKVYSAMESAFQEAKSDSTQPVCLLLKTVKGYGVKFTEESDSGGHGYPLKAYDERLTDFINEIYDGSAPAEFIERANKIVASKPKSVEKKQTDIVSEKVQVGISKGAIRAAKEGAPVFSICCDVPGSTGIKGFQKEFPDRFIDVGIAESNMVGMAAGMSKQGLIPIVDSFAQFGVTKGNLPLNMAVQSLAPIIGVFTHAGLQDAADGASHQATTFVSALGAIPGVTLVHCACSNGAESYIYQSIKRFESEVNSGKVPDAVILLLGRENYPQYINSDENYDWGKPQIIEEGSDVTIVATGPMVFEAIKAHKVLKEQGVSATVINNPFVNRPDVKTIGDHVIKTKGNLITIEDHQLVGGMGSILAHALALHGTSFKMDSIGINNEFGRSAYKACHLYDNNGMNSDAIVKSVKKMVNNS